MTITIEQIEDLANTLEAEEGARRAKLLRLIAAHARIIAVREPERYEPTPTECRDEEGHFDNSFPPRIKYTCRTGPKLIKVHDNETDDIATSPGFYYSWKRVTTDPGLYVGRDGTLYGCDETGTGELGRFAARPGDHNVDVELEWSELYVEDVSTEALEGAEAELRVIAFPSSRTAA